MPRKPCYWTRKLELELVEFVRQKEFIWKPIGNTNHLIQQKYKAYAEFAARLGRGFTARSVRDRWVNIRSTFNHNLRRVDKSRETAQSISEVYVPCWPLWKPLQFLRESTLKDVNYVSILDYNTHEDFKDMTSNVEVKEENQIDYEVDLGIRQRGQRTDRPRKKSQKITNNIDNCKQVLDDLIKAMSPLLEHTAEGSQYWFFGKHVTERLNAMREIDADCASQEIMKLLEGSEG
ncbi:uncharacterized protein LOC123662935 [Melitaea cinxia]|uniref:uncharacterized protein LOC123662935 n=1 Tax=Melitaea cinxia TaxID=113334 RepID=UPI001E2739A0|nr:uncharacterized protein LOC123662935 [Melitaea cinxia]